MIPRLVDCGFFFDVNQTVTIASNLCLLNIGGNNEQKQNWRERTDSLLPSHICVSSGYGSSIVTISQSSSPYESKLACFIKKVKKI